MGQMPDIAGREMAMGTRHRIARSTLERAIFCGKVASTRWNGVYFTGSHLTIKASWWSDPYRLGQVALRG
jgi:hypothetical protein